MRSRQEGGGRYRVADMPSGPNTRRASRRSSGAPEIRSPICASTIAPRPEYPKRSPGAAAGGAAPTRPRAAERDPAARHSGGHADRGAVGLAAEVVHRAGEGQAVEAGPGRRRLGDARARGEGRARATGDERAHECSEAAPHGWASGTMTPAPMRYAGGRLIGSLPVIGTFPRSASATARSEARTPLQAIRYDRTVGVWVRR